MDGKAQVDEYIINSLPALAEKTTFLWDGFYSKNVRYPNFTFYFLTSAGKHVWVQRVGAQTIVPMSGRWWKECWRGPRSVSHPSWHMRLQLRSGWKTTSCYGCRQSLWDEIGRHIEAVYVHSDLDTVD